MTATMHGAAINEGRLGASMKRTSWGYALTGRDKQTVVAWIGVLWPDVSPGHQRRVDGGYAEDASLGLRLGRMGH